MRAPREEIAESGTERLCASTSGIILQSFSLVGHVISEEIERTELLTDDGRTDGHPTHFMRLSRRDNLKITDHLHVCAMKTDDGRARFVVLQDGSQNGRKITVNLELGIGKWKHPVPAYVAERCEFLVRNGNHHNERHPNMHCPRSISK